jgi:hypothetical protein
MSLSSKTSRSSVRSPSSTGGDVPDPAVYEADPSNPPVPPIGAKGRAVTNADGRVIAFCWVAAEIADEVLDDRCNDFLDRYEPATRTQRPRLVPD